VSVNKNYRLSLESLYGKAKSKNEEFRKLSTSFQKFAGQNPDLRLSPTTLQPEITLGVNDYGEKCA
jgi:hypothetical protein